MADNKTIEQLAEERVKEAQKTKEFRDTSVVKYTRKYKAAIEIVTSKDLSEIEKDKVTAYKLIEKSKVWPKIDVEKLKSEGYSSGYCYFITKLRESLTNKPYDDEKARRMYVILVETIQPILLEKRNLDDLKDALSSFYYAVGQQITKELKDLDKVPSWMSVNYETSVREPLVEMVTGKTFINMVKLKSDAAKNHFISAYLYNEFTQGQRDKLIESKKHQIAELKESTIKKLSEYKEKMQELTDDREKSMYSHDVFGYGFDYKRDNVDEYVNGRIAAYDKAYLSVEKTLSGLYTVRAEKWDWFYGTGEKKEAKAKDTPRFKSILEEYGMNVGHKAVPLSHIKRTNSLKLPDIAVKSIVELFGFKDIVYGNYVRDKESEAHTRYFISAILDMADILDMDIKQLNKAGDLSIFFGALGCGMFSKAFACYYPDRKAINLTKKNGDGTVSHEWGHFFDNICGEGTDKKAIPYFATTGNVYLNIPEIKQCFDDIKKFWDSGEEKTIIKTFYGIEGETPRQYIYGENIDEATENFWKKYPKAKDYYTVMFDKSYSDYYSYLAIKFGTLIEGMTGMKSGGKVYALQVPLIVKSSYFKYISTEYDMNAGKLAETYYTNPKEMFARCFEAYISEKMKQRNIENTYLCEYAHHYVYAFTTTLLPPEYIPYPYGKELEQIVVLYDKLFAEIKKHFYIGGFKWETDDRESQYVELKGEPTEDKEEKAITVEDGNVETLQDEQKEESELSDKTKDILERIDLLTEMLESEGDDSKKQDYRDRIELLSEMLEDEKQNIFQQKAETEVEIQQQKENIIEQTKESMEQPKKEEVISEKPITSNFQINNVENNQAAEKTDVFSKEVNYDTRKVLNRAEDVKIEKSVVDQIEEKGVTIEFLDSLNIPIYKYKTQITLHGDFSDVSKERFGGYKVLIVNQNNTLGVKYVGIDIDKKRLIERCIGYAKSDWAFHMDSRGTEIRQMHMITKDTLEEVKQKCIGIFNSIPDVYVGDKHFGLYSIPMYGIFGVITINLNAIYENNLWQFISFLTDGKIGSSEDLAMLEEQEKAKEMRLLEQMRAEREEKEKKTEELAKPYIEKLKNSCPYPTISEYPNYKRFIIGKIIKERSYGSDDGFKVMIVLYYVEGGLYFKRYVNDWNEINTSFSRSYHEKRKKIDSFKIKLEENIKKGLYSLAWFEPLPEKKERQVRESGQRAEKPEMSDVVSGTAEYEVIKSKHTKTGDDIWILKLKSTLDRDQWKEFETKMKKHRGYYSSFVRGFIFKSEPKID